MVYRWVFLFGLSPQDINLMNLSTEPVQLVLSLLYISSLDVSFMFGCVCSRHGFQCMLLIRIYRYMCAYPCTPLGIHHTSRWRVSDLPLKIVLMFIFPPLRQCVCVSREKLYRGCPAQKRKGILGIFKFFKKFIVDALLNTMHGNKITPI